MRIGYHPPMQIRRRRHALLAALLCAVAFSGGPCLAAGSRPVPAISRVLIVRVDGLRPDLLLRAKTPTLHRLMREGTFTMWARTAAVAVTLPSHVSMLTGVAPEKHGIVWNTNLPPERRIYPAWPTLFELARGAGYTTAMAAGKSKFSALEKPGTLTWSYVPGEAAISDGAVADTALRWIVRYAPQVLFVHLPTVDTVGHDRGWGSPEQLSAIEAADGCIGRILAGLSRRGVLDSTVVVVSADHGGAGRTHGPGDPRSLEIPWIVSGPGIARDRDLTTNGDLEIRTEDTFATVCWLLGITPPKPIDGHPVTQILGAATKLPRRLQ